MDTKLFSQYGLEPWIGSAYKESNPKILAIGESRYDDNPTWTDRNIIQYSADGKRDKTFTNFIQAVTGFHNSEGAYDAVSFWKKISFYNYNREAYPGGPRIPLHDGDRLAQVNQICLRIMLEALSPTHCIVWGKKNWCFIKPDKWEWTETKSIPGDISNFEYCSASRDGNHVLFTYINHPSTAFPSLKWYPQINRFLQLMEFTSE